MYQNIEKMINDSIKTYDDATHRLTLTLDKREREEWILVIKNETRIIEQLLEQLPRNEVRIVTGVLN